MMQSILSYIIHDTVFLLLHYALSIIDVIYSEIFCYFIIGVIDLTNQKLVYIFNLNHDVSNKVTLQSLFKNSLVNVVFYPFDVLLSVK
jgi:hypothetical protein